MEGIPEGTPTPNSGLHGPPELHLLYYNQSIELAAGQVVGEAQMIQFQDNL